MVRYARERSIDTRTVSALILAVDGVHAAIGDGRRQIAGTEGADARGGGRTRTARLLALSVPADRKSVV